MAKGRTTTATYEGREYEIPEMWLMGQTQLGKSMVEAIAHWAYQTHLAELEES